MEKGLVSVVIPTYGRADMLDRAINSVLKQTYENIEIIIVNDNDITSPQYCETLEVLSKYNLNTKIKIISDGKNVGGSLARNKGITAGKGEYVTFLDDDDYFYPTKIFDQLEHINENDIDVSVCCMDVEKNGIITREKKSYPEIGDLNSFIIKGSCYTPMILAKKNMIIKVGNFSNAKRFQDHILLLKFLENKVKIQVLKKFLFVHNDHDGPRITKKNIDGYKDRWLIEEKLISSLNEKTIKKYWFNRNLIELMYGNNLNNRSEKFTFLIKNYKNVNSFSNFLINSKLVLKIFLSKKL